MKKIFTLTLTLALTLFCALSFGQNTSVADGEMKTYYLVLLKKGPVRSQDSLSAAKIQEGHLAHLTAMHKAGKLTMAGPFLDDWDTRGILIMNVATEEEARKLTSEDPAVKAGRLIVEIHPWMSKKGTMLN